MDTTPRPLDVDNTLLKKILAATRNAAVALGFTPENVANKSTDVNLGNSDTLYPSQLAVKTFALSVQSIAQSYTDELTRNHSTLTQASPTVIDFTSDPFRTCTLTGDITFSTANRAAALSVTIKLIAGASNRNLTFPVDWIFVGAAAPASLAANKVGILTVTCFWTADADCIAAYAAQP
jgi:hypothetical protein